MKTLTPLADRLQKPTDTNPTPESTLNRFGSSVILPDLQLRHYPPRGLPATPIQPHSIMLFSQNHGLCTCISLHFLSTGSVTLTETPSVVSSHWRLPFAIKQRL